MQANSADRNETTADRFAKRRAEAQVTAEPADVEPVEFVEPSGTRRTKPARWEQSGAHLAEHSPETMRDLRNPFAA